MQVEACLTMPNHLNRYRKQHWPTTRAAGIVILILALGTGLIMICCSERRAQTNSLSEILHPPAWAEKYYLDTILDAESAVLLDPDRNRIIYEKRMHERMYPASTTKILTALIAIENSDPNEIVAVGREIYLVPKDGSSAGLCEGEKIRMMDLLFGLMLPSGNDAAYVIAAQIAGKRLGRNRANTGESISYFVKMMNQRAIKAGARMSHFANPDGYHDSHHYSTSFDLAIIAREAMGSPLFRKVVSRSTYSRFTPDEDWRNRHEDRRPHYDFIRAAYREKALSNRFVGIWENRNLLLDPQNSFYYPEANGIKTGHTAEAGYCLVVSASRRGKHLIAVVLRSTQTGVWNDAAILLNHGFAGR